MKLEIEVKRRRFSTTQGQADVYVNGEMVISFGDTIEIINDGQPYYSEKIGNWASIVPESARYDPQFDCIVFKYYEEAC